MSQFLPDARPPAEERVFFAVGGCELGLALVARSERGVCAIFLGDDASALERALRELFPAVEAGEGDERLDGFLRAVVEFVATPARGLNLPLDIRGTAFQRRVWQALLDIPPASLVSYGEIARRIGAPQAVRAVAGACAANALALAIPCHRVVRADGALSGYRWGVERKRALLEREARAVGIR